MFTDGLLFTLKVLTAGSENKNHCTNGHGHGIYLIFQNEKKSLINLNEYGKLLDADK